MTATVISTAPQGSAEWLAERRNGIGGSDVAALLGYNPWRTQLDVWQDKRGDTEPQPTNDFMLWGSLLEPVVRDHYVTQHPGTFVEEVPGILAHPDHPMCRASLDGLAHAKDATRLLEVKCSKNPWPDGTLPDSYLAQVLWYLGITGLDEAHVAALFNGNSYTERVVAADPDWFERVLSYVSAWWQRHIVDGEMPEPDPVRDRDALAGLWAPDGSTAVLDDELIAELRDTKAALAAAKTDAEIAAAKVQLRMRTATTAVDSSGQRVASWGAVSGRTQLDIKRLRAELPDVAKDFEITTTETRRFAVAKEGK